MKREATTVAGATLGEKPLATTVAGATLGGKPLVTTVAGATLGGKPLAITVAGATLGWWFGILAGTTLGGLVLFFGGSVAGRLVGGLIAGLIGGACESLTLSSIRGRRLRFTGASALVTSLVTLLLLGVQSMPWLVGGIFGAALGLSQAVATALPRREVALRGVTSAAAWSLGFVVLHGGGTFGKLGVLAPGLAALMVGVVTWRRAGATQAGAGAGATRATTA